MALKKVPSRATVMAAVIASAERHNVDPNVVLSKVRTVKIVAARADAIRAIWRSEPGRYSITGMGRAFGVHHATVLYHVSDETYRAKQASRNAWFRRHASKEIVHAAP